MKTLVQKDVSRSKKINSFGLAVLLTAMVFGVSTKVAQASPELVKSKNCAACHNVDKKSIGPSFKDIAAKYGSDPKAVEMLVGKVRGGGVGTWGNIMMPANPQVSAAEAETLVRWVLAQK